MIIYLLKFRTKENCYQTKNTNHVDIRHTLSGLTHVADTYMSSFPIGIPIPCTPRSPKPRIRLHFVIKIISTCWGGQLYHRHPLPFFLSHWSTFPVVFYTKPNSSGQPVKHWGKSLMLSIMSDNRKGMFELTRGST